MKTYLPLFWATDLGIDYGAPTLYLHDLLPAVGQNTLAAFDWQAHLTPGETVQLIWCPPVSDLNGWSEQPSEIALSHLLRARVIRALPVAANAHGLLHGKYRYEFEVLACEALLPVLRALPPAPDAWHLSWDEVRVCGRAEVAGLIYLTASAPYETFMEMLLEQDGEQLTGLFSLHMNPGSSTCDLGRKRLVGDELRAIRHALDIARPLKDTQAAYIAEGPAPE
ncbi:hypothetical protein [Pseudomonas sp. CF161]|uniref:hypothetical protein n=1 Tax=Pseudomonas sp. CF161 TaxID=911241 RepID=UPI0003553A8F|nr:hypothetical protein [Pseudomonas sp. CF161]EPL05026.1 hypothetical protein CF161_23586 [Pseudomonas sp. CF161]